MSVVAIFCIDSICQSKNGLYMMTAKLFLFLFRYCQLLERSRTENVVVPVEKCEVAVERVT